MKYIDFAARIVSIFIVFSLSECARTEQSCVTLGGKPGFCVNILECPPIFAALTNPKKETTTYLNNAFCSKKEATVCCSSKGNRNFLDEPFLNSTDELGLSNKDYCGLQHSDDYFRDSNETSIDEFPWLALIIHVAFEKGTTRVFPLCSGALISTRYVLTSTDCLNKRNDIDLIVRLGEFSAKDQTETDCVQAPRYDAVDCSTHQDYEIEERILHPFRVGFSYNNDIALLRLSNHVSYTDYVRPICLPLPGTKFASIGEIMYASGWNDQFFAKGTSVKRKIATQLITNSECGKRLRTTITRYNMCTVGHINNTEFQCYLDKGGPLVFSHKNQWHIEGILAEFSGRCDNFGPLLLMRVSEYLSWIEDNMRP